MRGQVLAEPAALVWGRLVMVSSPARGGNRHGPGLITSRSGPIITVMRRSDVVADHPRDVSRDISAIIVIFNRRFAFRVAGVPLDPPDITVGQVQGPSDGGMAKAVRPYTPLDSALTGCKLQDPGDFAVTHALVGGPVHDVAVGVLDPGGRPAQSLRRLGSLGMEQIGDLTPGLARGPQLGDAPGEACGPLGINARVRDE